LSLSVLRLQPIHFDTFSILTFVSGVVLGSSLVFFFIFHLFFQKIETKQIILLKNMNTIIGSITGIIAMVTLLILSLLFGW
jgi:hypothetical protein